MKDINFFQLVIAGMVGAFLAMWYLRRRSPKDEPKPKDEDSSRPPKQ